jgi:hypothetical protein
MFVVEVVVLLLLLLLLFKNNHSVDTIRQGTSSQTLNMFFLHDDMPEEEQPLVGDVCSESR